MRITEIINETNLSVIFLRISLYGSSSNPHHFQFPKSTGLLQITSSNGFDSLLRKCNTGKAGTQLPTRDFLTDCSL